MLDSLQKNTKKLKIMIVVITVAVEEFGRCASAAHVGLTKFGRTGAPVPRDGTWMTH